jgi:hypothetical protein
MTFFNLCFPVQVALLRPADPSSKHSYRFSSRLKKLKLNGFPRVPYAPEGATEINYVVRTNKMICLRDSNIFFFSCSSNTLQWYTVYDYTVVAGGPREICGLKQKVWETFLFWQKSGRWREGKGINPEGARWDGPHTHTIMSIRHINKVVAVDQQRHPLRRY